MRREPKLALRKIAQRMLQIAQTHELRARNINTIDDREVMFSLKFIIWLVGLSDGGITQIYMDDF